MDLIINRRGKGYIYKIDDSGVLITSVHKNGLTSEDHIAFENIRKEKLFYKNTRPQYLIAAGVFFLIVSLIVLDRMNSPEFPWIAFGMWTFLFLCLLSAYFVHREKVYFLKTFEGKFLKFIVQKNESEIAAFVDKVVTARNRVLKLKYGTPNDFISYDSQYSNFNLLLREGVITEEEYKNNLKTLSETFRQHTPVRISNRFSNN